MAESQAARLFLHTFLFSSIAEYVLLRFLSRLGPVFPQGKISSLVLEAFYYAGALALNFASITGLIFLVLWIANSFKGKKGVLYPLPVLAALMVSAAGFLLSFYTTIISTQGQVLLLTGFSWLSMLLALLAWRREKKESLLILLVFLSYTLLYFQFWARRDILDFTPVRAGSLLAIAELLAILAPLMVLYVYKPPGNGRAFALAGIAGGAVFILYLFRPEIAAAIAMWNQSFTSYLPFLVYPLAVGLYIYNIAALYSSGRHRTVAIGLALIALGGFRLEYNYFNFLALTGFLLLAKGARKRPEPLEPWGDEE